MALKLVESRPATEEEKRKAQELADDGEWLRSHSEKIWEEYKGKYVAVAKQTIFVGNSYKEAIHNAKQKYPQVEPLIRHIPYKRRLWVL